MKKETENKILKELWNMSKHYTARSLILTAGINIFLIGCLIILKLFGIWPYAWWTVLIGAGVHLCIDVCCTTIVVIGVIIVAILVAVNTWLESK